MQIDLSKEEATTLREILQERVTELDREISNTDNRKYKGALRETERQVERILGVVTVAIEAPASGPASREPRDDVDDGELGHS
jgi:hypothetical protein